MKIEYDYEFVKAMKKEYIVIQDIKLYDWYDFDGDEDKHMCLLKYPYINIDNESPYFYFSNVKELEEQLHNIRIINEDDIEWLGEEGLKYYDVLKNIESSRIESEAIILLEDFKVENEIID